MRVTDEVACGHLAPKVVSPASGSRDASGEVKEHPSDEHGGRPHLPPASRVEGEAAHERIDAAAQVVAGEDEGEGAGPEDRPAEDLGFFGGVAGHEEQPDPEGEAIEPERPMARPFLFPEQPVGRGAGQRRLRRGWAASPAWVR